MTGGKDLTGFFSFILYNIINKIKNIINIIFNDFKLNFNDSKVGGTMDEKTKEALLVDIAPYIEDIEFFKELLENSRDIEDLKRKLKELLKKEENITRKTDIKIILNKIESTP